MARSLKNNGKIGDINMVLKLSLRILLTRRTRERLSGAFRTLTESSLIICVRFLNGSTPQIGEYRDWLTIHAFTEA